jgi:hypothetical protein
MSDVRDPHGHPAWTGGVPSRPAATRLVIGLLVIALGALFMLDNLGVIAAGQILRWWPVLLLVYGGMRLTGAGCRRGLLMGILCTVLGGLLTLREAVGLSIDPWALWPLLLIAWGGSLLAGSRRHRHAAGATPVQDPDAGLNTFVVWSGIEHKVTSPSFRGGEITAIMGGAEIDLRQARMPEGRAVVHVTILWGGVELFVPGDWMVSVEALPLMAGIEDSSRAPSGEARGHLVVKGLVLMGGLEIRN